MALASCGCIMSLATLPTIFLLLSYFILIYIINCLCPTLENINKQTTQRSGMTVSVLIRKYEKFSVKFSQKCPIHPGPTFLRDDLAKGRFIQLAYLTRINNKVGVLHDVQQSGRYWDRSSALPYRGDSL